MKIRPVLLGIALISACVVAVYRSQDEPIFNSERVSFETHTAPEIAPVSQSRSAANRTEPAAVASVPTLTQRRQDIFDAPDVLAAALWVKTNGTPDEKVMAADALRECGGFLVNPVAAEPEATPDAESAATRAKHLLQQRCSGVARLGAPDRQALVKALQDGAASGSRIQQLRDISKREGAGDTRWYEAEKSAIGSALYGDDKLLQREAFWVVHDAIDRNAPGGAARRDALIDALAEPLVNERLSTFEALEACALANLCDSAARDAAPAVALDARTDEDRRLARLYRDAYVGKLPLDAILAIR